MSKFAFEAIDGAIYNNNSYPSAAQFTQHQLIGGTYEMYSESAGRDLCVLVPNHLLQNSYGGVPDRWWSPGELHKVYLNFYTYQVEDGKDVVLGGQLLGYFRKIED